MIDTACILFSALMCVYVAFRAIQLDKAMAWFAGVLPAVRAAGAMLVPAKPPGWRERGRPVEQDRAAQRGWRDRQPRDRSARGRRHAS